MTTLCQLDLNTARVLAQWGYGSTDGLSRRRLICANGFDVTVVSAANPNLIVCDTRSVLTRETKKDTFQRSETDKGVGCFAGLNEFLARCGVMEDAEMVTGGSCADGDLGVYLMEKNPNLPFNSIVWMGIIKLYHDVEFNGDQLIQALRAVGYPVSGWKVVRNYITQVPQLQLALPEETVTEKNGEIFPVQITIVDAEQLQINANYLNDLVNKSSQWDKDVTLEAFVTLLLDYPI